MKYSSEFMNSIPLSKRPFGFIFCNSIQRSIRRPYEQHSCEIEIREDGKSAVFGLKLIDVRRQEKRYHIMVYPNGESKDMLFSAVIDYIDENTSSLEYRVSVANPLFLDVYEYIIQVVHIIVHDLILEDVPPKDLKTGKRLPVWYVGFTSPLIDSDDKFGYEFTVPELAETISFLEEKGG